MLPENATDTAPPECTDEAAPLAPAADAPAAPAGKLAEVGAADEGTVESALGLGAESAQLGALPAPAPAPRRARVAAERLGMGWMAAAADGGIADGVWNSEKS
jgi:hypothetical protein